MSTLNLKTVEFGPCGSDNSIQSLITQALHEIVMKNGTLTLSEMGYLGMNTVSFVEDHIEVKVFFASELSMIGTKQINASKQYRVNPVFKVFQNVLFVGNLESAITFEIAQVPKYDIIEDEMGKASVKIKKKMENNVEVTVMHCNLGLMLAAILNHDVADPNFSIKAETLGSNTADEDHIIIQMGTKKEFPVRITVTYDPAYTPFKVDSVYQYLIRKMTESSSKKTLQKELVKNATKDASKQKRKSYKIEHGKISKFR